MELNKSLVKLQKILGYSRCLYPLYPHETTKCRTSEMARAPLSGGGVHPDPWGFMIRYNIFQMNGSTTK